MGYLYGAMGKPDEAITSFRKAAELAPRAPAHREALAVFYGIMDRPDEAKRELGAARQLAGDRGTIYLDILQEAILGDAEKAGRLLAAAAAAGQLTKHQIRRDPNVAIVLDAARAGALLE
jgi:Flp pilus assembly protein TadD